MNSEQLLLTACCLPLTEQEVRVTDRLDLLKEGARVVKGREYQELLLKIDQLVENIILGTFRLRDDDLDSLKEDSVLQAARDLVKTVKQARKLKAELGA